GFLCGGGVILSVFRWPRRGGVARGPQTPDKKKPNTPADGLPPGVIECATRDAQGALWFGGSGGLARLIPEPDKPRQAPTILLTGLRVAGGRRPLSQIGGESLNALSPPPPQTHVSGDFLGVGPRPVEER